jgi:molybdenum cofactor biosynthesis enzyme MoaA
LNGLNELTITTNGVLTKPYVAGLKALGIKSVNLSLDTLDPNRFFAITRRDEFGQVMETMEELLKNEMEVKINTVVMAGKNTQDIHPLVALTKDLPVSVRFIEEMPFNGDGHHYSGVYWDHVRILNEISSGFPTIKKLSDPPFSTAYNYQIRGHKGSIGIIAAYSRTFCGTCNRIRLTPDGTLRTCLYGTGVMNIRDEIRSGVSEVKLSQSLLSAFNTRELNGQEAEKNRLASPQESMATIGG